MRWEGECWSATTVMYADGEMLALLVVTLHHFRNITC